MMTNGWQEVPLGSLLTRIKDDVLIEDFEKYQRLTIRTNNKGVEIRDELEGHLIGTKNQYVVYGGQFLLSKIDAMNGAFGIVPENVENGIITSNFWAYDVDEEKLFSKYFNYLTHTCSFQEFCIQASSGTTHRKYLREDLFLAMEIPLPPLTEQRRIVAHIESLARRVNDAQRLREEANAETDIVIKAARNQIIEDLKQKNKTYALNEICTKITDGPHVSPNYVSKSEGVPFISVRNVNETGLDFSTAQYVSRKDHEEFSKRVNVEKGDVLFHKVGSTGTARRVDIDIEFSIWVNLALLKPKRELIDGAFMEHMLNAPSVREHTNSMTAGSSTQYIGLGKIGKIEIPVLPLDEQRRIVAYLDGLQAKVNALRELQSQSQEELDALLPSVLDRAFKGQL